MDREVDDQLPSDLHLGDVDPAISSPHLVADRGHRTTGEGVHGQVECVPGVGDHSLYLRFDAIDTAVVATTEEAHDHGMFS